MKIKLKESIRANGIQYLPPSVVDADEIGITQADVDVLVRRGTAELVDADAPAEVEQTAEEVAESAAEVPAEVPAPEVINLGDEPEEAPAKPAAKGKKR